MNLPTLPAELNNALSILAWLLTILATVLVLVALWRIGCFLGSLARASGEEEDPNVS